MMEIDLNIFVKEKKKRFWQYIIVESIILLLMVIVLLWCIKHERQDLMICSVWAYAILVSISLPMFLGSLPYLAPAAIITLSQKIKQLVIKRLAVCESLMQSYPQKVQRLYKLLEQQKIEEGGEILKASFFELEEKADALMDKLFWDLHTEQTSKIMQINKQLTTCFKSYLSWSVGYLERRAQYLESGAYKTNLVPPDFFDEKDIDVFHKILKKV